MLTSKQFVTELAREDVILSPSEREEMKHRFGDKVLQMGHRNKDGSINVPVDCIIEAAQSLETQTLTEAAEIINNEDMVSMLQSGEALVEEVIKARERRLLQLIQTYQDEGKTDRSQILWKQIEKAVFGVDFKD